MIMFLASIYIAIILNNKKYKILKNKNNIDKQL